jgi:nucleotide-binding universal stress UspA family protein
MFETILVPLDGSELSEAALAPAAELRAKFNARLILLRVVEPASHHLVQTPGVFESPAAAVANVELIQKMTEAEKDEAHTYLNALHQKLGGDARIEPLLIEGEPADAIAEMAEKQGAGLIVMSSRGRGGLGRLVFGSVADAIVHNSPIPVLLIRPEDKKDS